MPLNLEARQEAERLLNLLKQLSPQEQAAVLQLVCGARLLAESKKKKQ